jgi:hypothetical protein
MKQRVDRKVCLLYGKFLKWLDDELTHRQNGKLAEWWVDEMAS